MLSYAEIKPNMESKRNNKDTKKGVYDSLVLSVLLYTALRHGPLKKPESGNSMYLK